MARIRKNQSTDGKFYRAAFEWMGVGLEFCIVIGFFMFIGYWLDKWDDSSPGWMIMGFFFGFGVMMYIILKRAKRTEKELEFLEHEQDDETDDEK